MQQSTPKLTRYWPLICLILISALAAIALDMGYFRGAWMHYFMGFFLCQFAMLKLFQPMHFAEGFRMYDLLARHLPFYAYLYPVIELVLGLGYLSFYVPIIIYSGTIFFLGIGAIGVVLALRRGLDVRCACMGTILNVPLSTVTLVEDLSMVAMALFLLVTI